MLKKSKTLSTVERERVIHLRSMIEITSKEVITELRITDLLAREKEEVEVIDLEVEVIIEREKIRVTNQAIKEVMINITEEEDKTITKEITDMRETTEILDIKIIVEDSSKDQALKIQPRDRKIKVTDTRRETLIIIKREVTETSIEREKKDMTSEDKIKVNIISSGNNI
jgi:hypothetical protein